MKKLLLCLLPLLLASVLGCAGDPIRRQSLILDAAYQRGEISASDYYARKNELLAIKSQKQAIIGAAIIKSP